MSHSIPFDLVGFTSILLITYYVPSIVMVLREKKVCKKTPGIIVALVDELYALIEHIHAH